LTDDAASQKPFFLFSAFFFLLSAMRWEEGKSMELSASWFRLIPHSENERNFHHFDAVVLNNRFARISEQQNLRMFSPVYEKACLPNCFSSFLSYVFWFSQTQTTFALMSQHPKKKKKLWMKNDKMCEVKIGNPIQMIYA
jgi:hypothetical protein